MHIYYIIWINVTEISFTQQFVSIDQVNLYFVTALILPAACYSHGFIETVDILHCTVYIVHCTLGCGLYCVVYNALVHGVYYIMTYTNTLVHY